MSSFGYNILAGVKNDEGVVISRGRYGALHEEHLNSSLGTWFLVQANTDQWMQGCSGRCLSATNLMNKLGQEQINPQIIRDEVMTMNPNFNS